MSQGYRDTQSLARLFALGLAYGLRDRLGAGLVGVYLHGGLATGDDLPGTSDADLIVVCESPLPKGQRDSLRDLLTSSALPPGFPAVDVGVLTSQVAAQPERPVCWEMVITSP